MSSRSSVPVPAVPAAPPPPIAPDADAARAAGRGGLAVAGAKVWFIVVGMVQQTLLPHLIGLDGYGAFSSVQAIANIPNNVIVTASIQGVSRAVAEAGTAPEAVASAQRRALLLHAALAPCLALLFVSLAPVLADFEHAPHLVTPLRIFGAVLLVYALYAPVIGALNGRRRFLAQAGLDVTAAALRTVGLLGGAWLFAHSLRDGVTGAATGMAVAAACILPVSLVLARAPRPASASASPAHQPHAASRTNFEHLALVARLAVAQLFLNLLMQADIWLLRRFAHESGVVAGIAGDALRIETDKLVGAYRAAQLFAFLPYQLLISITFILFPMVASSHAAGDKLAVARYVRTGARLALVLAGMMVACIAGLAPQLLRFAFSLEAATRAGDALRILTVGQGAFALFGIEMTVLASLGRERSSAVLTAAATLSVGVLCLLLVPGAPFDATLLARSAMATATALGFAAVLGAVLVKRAAGAFLAPSTLVRTLVALLIAILVGRTLPWAGHLLVPVEAAFVAAVYLAVLAATRELTTTDLTTIKRALGRKG